MSEADKTAVWNERQAILDYLRTHLQDEPFIKSTLESIEKGRHHKPRYEVLPFKCRNELGCITIYVVWDNKTRTPCMVPSLSIEIAQAECDKLDGESDEK